MTDEVTISKSKLEKTINKIHELQSDLQIAMEALAFYADGDHFDYDNLKQEIVKDYGTVAGNALTQINGKEG